MSVSDAGNAGEDARELSPLMSSRYDEMSAQLPDTNAIKVFTFEIAWEVVNKVGGIYTVIKTKTAETVKQLGEQYCLIGPYQEATAKLQFEAQVPESEVMRNTLAAMRAKGVTVHFGRWLIDGAPKVVLFDLESCMGRLAEWRHQLWEQTRIGFPDDDMESTRSTLFGFLTAWFLGEYLHQLELSGDVETKLIAHFHEWLAGIGLVLLRVRKLPIATVFTTHATLLGRYLCADSKIDFYNHLSEFNPDKEAGDRGIYHRYCIERAAVYAAHTFTTVSQITADEAQHLLKRKADIVTPNGLNSYKFAALHEFQTLHAAAKAKIEKFVHGHFYGHLDFDLDNTLYFFLAGRYEYRNKGADLYLEALGRLNKRLQKSGSKTTIVAFLIMPTPTNSFNIESLRGQAVNKRLHDTVSDIKAKVGEKLYSEISRGNIPDTADLLDKADLVKLKRCVYTTQSSAPPPIVTHNVVNDKEDEVLACCRRIELFNQRHDRVKIVFHPEFLNSSSPLLPIDYDDFVRGCHLGVFPSYYEPWGYTPAECTVMGVPSITSNLSGFGCFLEEQVADPASYGIYVVDRRFKSPEESVNQLTDYMHTYTNFNRRQRVNLRNRTERLSDLLGWDTLSQYYVVAREMAVKAAFPELSPQMELRELDVKGVARSVTPDRPHKPGRRNRFNPEGKSLSESSVPPGQWSMA